jgi:hypothetical protein
MNKKLKYAVLGSGHGGRAVCGQIAEKDYPVIMYEPLPWILKQPQKKPMSS